MKRLIALLLALSALFSLAACGGTNAFALAEATYPESAPYPDEAKYSGAKHEAARRSMARSTIMSARRCPRCSRVRTAKTPCARR